MSPTRDCFGDQAISSNPDQVQVLFVSEHALWPMDQGSCVHGYHMAAALRDLGVKVGIASHHPLPGNAPPEMRRMSIAWPETGDEDVDRLMAGWKGFGAVARRRLARYQGRDLSQFAGVIPLVDCLKPSVVIALGQHGPLMLQALRGVGRCKLVWYAADEPVYFQLSCMRREPVTQWPSRWTKVALYAALEALFVRGLDGAVGVSPLDSRLLRWVGGVRRVVTIRNGVDLDRYRPESSSKPSTEPRSLVFWGRMDFEPNVDAVLWFARRVWPRLRWYRPDATWQIVGKNPDPRVQRLSALPGVSVLGEVPDIRPYAQTAAVTVLPMRCGGGIKNKLLEAAAMGRPIAASPRALRGLVWDRDRPPVLQCRTPDQWVHTIRRLWADQSLAKSVGRHARLWVQKNHTWSVAAQTLTRWIASMPDGPLLPGPFVLADTGREVAIREAA